MNPRANLLDPAIRTNPYPLYTRQRHGSPVSQVDPGGLWAITRHDDVMHILKNPQIFSSEGFRQAYRPPWIDDYPLADSLLVMDPPRHTRLRSIVNRAFGIAVISRIEADMRRIAADIVSGLTPGQEVDFVHDFSMPMPLGVLGILLGLPRELHPLLRRWAEHMAQFTGIGPLETERQAAMRATVEETRGHFIAVLEDRKLNPGNNLISDLVRARVDGEALTTQEMVGFMFLLLIGGLETTVNLLSHSALRLQLQPELMTRLRDKPELVPRFVDEVLRHEPPAHGVMRLTTQEVELSGVRLPAGSRLMLLMGSANRDESHTPDPDRFDMDRPPQTLPFGYGIHFCLGAQLARFEAKLALEALVARFGSLGAGSAPVRWNSSLIVRGPSQLLLVPQLP